MLLHNGQVQSVPRGQAGMAHDNFFCPFRRGLINGKHLICNTEQGIERRLDRISAVNRHIAMQDFLKNLGVCHKTLPFTGQLLKQSPRVCLMRVRRANEVHRNIRIHKNHDCDSPV